MTSVSSLPKRLYHGTNIVSAVRILESQRLSATVPVDGEEPVVCTTALKAIARCFAVEFLRENSSHEVGVIFAIDSSRFASETGYENVQTETASFDEKEWRIADDIQLSDVVGVQCVGATKRLKSERYLESLWEDHCSDIPYTRFAEHIANLAARQVTPQAQASPARHRP